MIRLRMKPEGEHKCLTCDNGTVIQFKDGVARTKCHYLGGEVQMHDKVTECSSYESRYDYAPNKMIANAWILEVKKGKPIGFLSPEDRKRKEED